MPSRVTAAAFGLMVLVQVAVPASTIVRRELVLRTGHRLRFRAAPIDPYDAFRGRYVQIRLAETSAPGPDRDLEHGRKVFALVAEDADGFGRFTGVSADRPAEGHYLEVTVVRREGRQVFFDLPFDRFYLEEAAAPAAETAFMNASRRGRETSAVVLRLRRGVAVLEELVIEGIPIREYLQRSR